MGRPAGLGRRLRPAAPRTGRDGRGTAAGDRHTTGRPSRAGTGGHPSGTAPRAGDDRGRVRGRRPLHRRRRAPRRLPPGVPPVPHGGRRPAGAVAPPGRLPRPVLAARGAAVGLVRAAVRRPLAGQLGHRRPRGPAHAARVDRVGGRRLPAGQPAARGRPDAAPGGQSLPSGDPAVPQPRLPARGRGAGPLPRRLRRPRRPGAAQHVRPDRPRRRLDPQARRTARGVRAFGRRCRRGIRRVAPRAGPQPGGVRHLVRARRGARPGLADLARRAASPGRPRGGRLRCRPRRRHRLPRLAPVAARRPAPRGDRRAPPSSRTCPSGSSGGGADAWAWQDVLAVGVTVGAPPDLFNTTGQDWGSPPLVPWRLQAADYEPFIQSVRGTIARRGRPADRPRDGAVPALVDPRRPPRRPRAPTCATPARTSSTSWRWRAHRAGAVVVGEDLGTVEPGVREALAERRDAVLHACCGSRTTSPGTGRAAPSPR